MSRDHDWKKSYLQNLSSEKIKRGKKMVVGIDMTTEGKKTS